MKRAQYSIAQRRAASQIGGDAVTGRGTAVSPPAYGVGVVDQARDERTGLPGRLKAGIEGLAGLALDDVRVHYNSSRPAQLQALAFTQGADIHVAPGQEQHLAHEAWHVVQQAQGRVRPTSRLDGEIAVNDDGGLEREADVMGARALQAARPVGRPVERARPPATGVVQGKLAKFKGQAELLRLLKNSGIALSGKELEPLCLIAERIGAQEDTTSENITERILRDPNIAQVFRDARLAVDQTPWGKPSKELTALESEVLGILKRITFFTGTKSEFVESIRTSGLSTTEGGKEGGGSDTNSVGSKRGTHMSESKGKVYVSRNYKEASGYAEKGTEPLMIFVPTKKQDVLQVDPRSQTGLYSQESLGMVDQTGGVFGGGVIGTVLEEMRATRKQDEELPSTKDIRQAWLSLIEKGALPRRTERLDQLAELQKYWYPILERLTDPDKNKGVINGAAATIIAMLNEMSDVEKLGLLSRLRLGKAENGAEIITGFLRGG